ncbi:hypothetical protein ACHAWT_006890 [Skeletonema menzelii]
MGGSKRSSRRGRGGGGRGRGRGRGGNIDASKQQNVEDKPSFQSSAREPPARQSQHHNLGREDQSAAVKHPQEPPPTDYRSGNNYIEDRSYKNSRRAGSKPVTRAEQKRATASTTQRQDPPDETHSVASRHSSANGFSKSNRDGRSRRKSRDHFNHNVERDSPLLDVEEQLQYEQYEDQHYQQYFLQPKQNNTDAPDPDEIQEYSSSHRQFSLAPLNVEMTSYTSKASKERKAKKEKRRLQQQQKAQQSQFSMGRYETGNSNQSESDGESYEFSYGDDGADTDESSEHGITRHEDFYNYDEDDSDDEDEERPLRRSRSSNKLPNNRRSPPPIMTRCERYQNRALVAAFAMVALLFVRDHTPWWKNHKTRVEFEKHHHHHEDGSDDDDNVRNVKLDPMAVYNSNDDDSTHTKDHDPLHKYIKEDNKYNEHSAGERISGRPAQKSLNHGFMDESYENRPQAKNSASTAAAVAGVRMGGSNAEVNEEEAAFLKSVKGKTKEYSSKADGGNRDQFVPPPPPMLENNKPPDATSLSSEVQPLSVNDQNQPTAAVNDQNQPTAAGFNAGIENVAEERAPSFSTEVAIEQQQMQPQQLPPTQTSDSLVQEQQQQIQSQQLIPPESDDSLLEWGDQQEHEVRLEPAQNGANIPPPNNRPIVSPQSPPANTFESASSSSTGFKPMANDAMSGSAFMSNSLKAQSAQEIKDVYKNSYYRWNHPFRQSVDEGKGRDVPVFWRIPRSASSTVEDVMSNCYHLAVASALGTRQGHDQDQTLSIVQFGNAKFVNVDMSNPAGIERAKAMNLGTSNIADAISTPFLYETASIFENVPDSGKCFTMLRHPVDRAISLYFRYQSDDSNPNTAQYKGLSIDEYAEQSTESNWMVRFLTSKRAGSLSWHDLESAKEVFGRKCLVGLVEKAEESIRRYERFFGWGDNRGSGYNSCVGDRLVKADKRNQHDSFEGTNAWEVLRKKNEYDVLLYEYAKNLYTQQSTMYENFY